MKEFLNIIKRNLKKESTKMCILFFVLYTTLAILLYKLSSMILIYNTEKFHLIVVILWGLFSILSLIYCVLTIKKIVE